MKKDGRILPILFTIGARPIETVNSGSPPPPNQRRPVPLRCGPRVARGHRDTVTRHSQSTGHAADAKTPSPQTSQPVTKITLHLNCFKILFNNDYTTAVFCNTVTVMDMHFGTVLDLDRGQHEGKHIAIVCIVL